MDKLLAVGLCIILLIFLLMLSIPLPYCFGGALGFLVLTAGVSMKSMMLYSFTQTTGTVLLASPMFILAGNYMGGSGIASRLLDLADAFIGRIKGGLGCVGVITEGQEAELDTGSDESIGFVASYLVLLLDPLAQG